MTDSVEKMKTQAKLVGNTEKSPYHNMSAITVIEKEEIGWKEGEKREMIKKTNISEVENPKVTSTLNLGYGIERKSEKFHNLSNPNTLDVVVDRICMQVSEARLLMQ